MNRRLHLYIQTQQHGFHAVRQPHKAAYDPTANVSQPMRSAYAKASKREANQDNLALPDFRLGSLTAATRRLAARSQARTPFQTPAERAIFFTTVVRSSRNQLLLLEIEICRILPVLTNSSTTSRLPDP